MLGIGPDDISVNKDMVIRIGVGFRILSDHAQGVSSQYGVVYNDPTLEAMVDYAEGIPLPASFQADVDGVVLGALSKHDGTTDSRDGMNVGLVTIDRATRKLTYAGAHGPMYLVRAGELLEYKGDRMPIGQNEGELVPFQLEEIDMQAGDRLYLFSDGIPDQFGGPKGKKLRTAGLRAWLL